MRMLYATTTLAAGGGRITRVDELLLARLPSFLLRYLLFDLANLGFIQVQHVALGSATNRVDVQSFQIEDYVRNVPSLRVPRL